MRRTRHTVISAALAVLVMAAAGSARAVDSTGKWLVDLGRDYPLSAQASLTDADARIALLFMQAAARVEPALAEPYYWQYDLLNALGETESAALAMREYLEREPQHVVGWLNWIALRFALLQTAEQRAEFCRDQLQNPKLPPAAKAVLHARLADYFWNRGLFPEARAEVATALQLDPWNIDALAVRNLLQPARAPRLILAESMLMQLQQQPGNFELTVSLADQLMQLGLESEATPWYAHAVELLALSNPSAPREQLQQEIQNHRKQVATTQPTTGPAAADAATLTAIQKALAQFPTAVLDYPLHPRKYLSLSVAMSQSQYQPGQSWWCTLQLKNIGPFPITLGPGMMVVPEVVLAFDLKGDQPRHIGPLVRVLMNRLPRLEAGQAIELRQTVKIGPVRSTMIGTPRVTHQIAMPAVLSPTRVVGADGQEFVVPTMGGWVTEPVRFERLGLSDDAQQVRDIAARCHGGAVEQRVEAVKLAAMLLAEHQHLAVGRLKYTAQPLATDVLVKALGAAAMDSDWPVRAQVAECLRWLVLDAQTRDMAGRLVNDSHWLVRGLGMRLMADQQGERFLPVLRNSATADPDEWVRRMCLALVERLTPPAQPTAATKPAMN